MWRSVALIAIAGGAGSVARYGLHRLVTSLWTGFPYGTLAVNVLGSLLFGLIWAATESRVASDGSNQAIDQTRLLLLVGFMGAFTTFSTFSFETVKLLEAQDYGRAVANVIVSVVLGFGALAVGLWVGWRV